jgi:hypothetical protein
MDVFIERANQDALLAAALDAGVDPARGGEVDSEAVGRRNPPSSARGRTRQSASRRLHEDA